MAKKLNTKIMVFGTFDGLHPGHLDFFQQAKSYGDFLVVSIARDINVPRFKGKKPMFDEDDRYMMAEQIKMVDKVVLGDKKNFMQHIKLESPDIICLGYDQWADEGNLREELDSIGLASTKIIRLKPFKKDKAKSKFLKPKWKQKLEI